MSGKQATEYHNKFLGEMCALKQAKIQSAPVSGVPLNKLKLCAVMPLDPSSLWEVLQVIRKLRIFSLVTLFDISWAITC